MVEINISVEMHVHQPLWAINSFVKKFPNSKYRVYINDDLITERNWNWDNNIFLHENFWIYGEFDKEYQIKIDSVVTILGQAKFMLKNFKVINYKYSIESEEDTKISFKTINT